MPALAFVFMRGGAPVSHKRLTDVSEALQGFGTKTTGRRDGGAGMLRIMSEPFTPEDKFDRGIVQTRDGQWVAFDGMLHHRSELARSLGLDGEAGRPSPMADSDLFARAWERWGEEAAERAEGTFAAAIWDPGRRCLTALCSPLAAPPLYWSVTHERAVVASAPRGVHAGSGLPRRIDDAHLASSMILHYSSRSTYFRNVQSLRPGEILSVGPGAHRVRRFYDLADHVRPVRVRRTEDYVEAGRAVVREAVAEAMRACETPALLLSSGLDSTTVAANALELLAGRLGGAPLVSFTARPAKDWAGRAPPGRIGDEGPLVRKLARMYPAMDARFVRAQHGAVDDTWQRTMELAELPARNVQNGHWGHECRRRAVAAGRRVVMNGHSGNATISYHGSERLAALFRQGRWTALRAEAAKVPSRRFLVDATICPFLPARVNAAVARRWLGVPSWTAYSAIHPRFAREMRVDARARSTGFDPYSQRARSRVEGQLRLLGYGQGEGRLAVAAMSAQHDISLRDPLRNRRLVEWCLGAPDDLYFRNGRPRMLVRLLMQGRVPDDILWARRRGYQLSDWHHRITPQLPRFRGEIEEWRSDPAVAERIDCDRLLRLIDTWPESPPMSRHDHPDWILARVGLPRALVTGRFIRFVEGRS